MGIVTNDIEMVTIDLKIVKNCKLVLRNDNEI
jgi:hypothetical protein